MGETLSLMSFFVSPIVFTNDFDYHNIAKKNFKYYILLLLLLLLYYMQYTHTHINLYI